MVDKKSQEIAMVGIVIDFVDYMKKEETAAPLKEWQKKIKQVAHVLEDSYFGSLTFKRGECIYGDVVGTNKKFVTKHGAMQFWGISFAIYKSLGYKVFFGRSSNPVSTILLQKLGGIPISKAYLEGTEEFMELVMIDLEKLKLPSLSCLYPE